MCGPWLCASSPIRWEAFIRVSLSVVSLWATSIDCMGRGGGGGGGGGGEEREEWEGERDVTALTFTIRHVHTTKAM